MTQQKRRFVTIEIVGGLDDPQSWRVPIRQAPCGYCGAGIGQPCKKTFTRRWGTTNGYRGQPYTNFHHEARWYRRAEIERLVRVGFLAEERHQAKVRKLRKRMTA